MTTKIATTSQPLIAQLVGRIREPMSLDEPFIIQDRVAQTNSRHVVVIWDAWDHSDRAERARTIAVAFEAAGIRDAIRVALGLTQQEVLDMGYFPYQIVANSKNTDGVRILHSIKRAVESAPGIHVRTGSSVQLRYPTLEHAQEAYRHLSAAVPGPYWAIIRDEGSGGIRND